MPEIQKEARNCHSCGLEAIDDCEMGKGHIPADENLVPCCYCLRNTNKAKVAAIADFYDEQWCRDANKNPILEDPDPDQQKLVRFLHTFQTVYAVT